MISNQYRYKSKQEYEHHWNFLRLYYFMTNIILTRCSACGGQLRNNNNFLAPSKLFDSIFVAHASRINNTTHLR